MFRKSKVKKYWNCIAAIRDVDCGGMLETGLPVSDDVTHVGIRAHFFGPRVAQNRFPVAFAGEMGEPFEWVLEFRYAGQRPDSPPLWWRIPKEKRPRPLPEALGIAPVNVLPLRE